MGSYYIYGSELNDPQLRALIAKTKDYNISNDDDDVKELIAQAKYPEYLYPTPASEQGKYEQISNPDGAKNDKGHLGDREFKNFYSKKSDNYSEFDISPNFGTEIDGIQLSELDDAGKNDLALLIEKKGLLVFRNQDLRDKSPKFLKEFGEYFGPLHIHPVALSQKDYPELFVTYRRPGDSSRWAKQFGATTTTHAWHSDISFEEYPASFSFFVALESPESGGDTVFLDTREAYRRLSPVFQKFLETLTVIHSNQYQNLGAEAKGFVNKVNKTYFTEHPLVRTHPVTGEKSLYFSRAFIQKVKGVKPEESDAILNFLHHSVLSNPEIQVRATHKGSSHGTVIVWDNRLALHTHTADFFLHETGPRHHYRLTVTGEKPYFDPNQPKGKSINGESLVDVLGGTE